MQLVLGKMNTYSLSFSLLQKVLANSTLKQRLERSPIQEIPHSSLHRAAPEAQVSNLTRLEEGRRETGETVGGGVPRVGAAAASPCPQPQLSPAPRPGLLHGAGSLGLSAAFH